MENENIKIEDTKKKKSKKKWIIIAIVIVLFVAIASSGSSETSTTVEPIDSTSTQAKEEATEAASEKETEKTPEEKTEDTSADATKGIAVGSAVSNDEVKISYKKCSTNFTKYSQYADIKKGHKIVRAVFDFENISSSDISLNSFSCYADGEKCEEFYSVDDYSSPVLETISAGRKLTNATVYFEVPKNAEKIELEYEADYWTGEKYIFIIK